MDRFEDIKLVAKAAGFVLHYGSPANTYTLSRYDGTSYGLAVWQFANLDLVTVFLMGWNAGRGQ